MIAAADEASKPLWAKCKECGHCWAAGYYPMEASKFADIVSGHSMCPKCGAAGYVAKQHDGELLEESA